MPAKPNALRRTPTRLQPGLARRACVLSCAVAVAVAACSRSWPEAPPGDPPGPVAAPSARSLLAGPPRRDPGGRGGLDAAAAEARADAPPARDAGATAPPIAASAELDGPLELLLAPGRPVYVALPRAARPARLVAHLHGQCAPPTYSCGKWLGAGVAVGALVCPTGNARCGDSPVGPPSWEAPSWAELVKAMDDDLEASIALVLAKRPGALRRDGAVLTGWSRGAFAAVPIARRHPGRWPYLVLVEADVPLGADALRASGVRAVALVAGELGDQLPGERRSVDALARDGFPARLFVMRRTGHLYSEDIEEVMRDALAFVLEH